MRASRFLAFVTVLCASTIAACSGGVGSACRSPDECANGLGCIGPDNPPVCGLAHESNCSSATDCPPGQVCSATADSCSETGFVAECQEPCGSTTCTNGVLCNAEHACEPVACDQGFTCPPWQRCDPAAPSSGGAVVLTHGCVDVDCTDDSGCPSGLLCVDGFCQEGEGVCMEEFAVPEEAPRE